VSTGASGASKTEGENIRSSAQRLASDRGTGEAARGLLALGFLLMIVNKVASLALRSPRGPLMDRVILKHQAGLLAPLVLGVLVATCIQGVTSFALTQLLSKEAQRLIAELRRKVQEHIAACRWHITTPIRAACWFRAS